jgi:hypothetical protein
MLHGQAATDPHTPLNQLTQTLRATHACYMHMNVLYRWWWYWGVFSPRNSISGLQILIPHILHPVPQSSNRLFLSDIPSEI